MEREQKGERKVDNRKKERIGERKVEENNGKRIERITERMGDMKMQKDKQEYVKMCDEGIEREEI